MLNMLRAKILTTGLTTGFTKQFAVTLACFALAGCTVGPDYQRPELPNSNAYTTSSGQTAAGQTLTGASDTSQRLAVGQDISKDWWTLFRSPALNTLIEQAFVASPTIEIAQRALNVAQQNVYAQQGYFFRRCKQTICPHVQNLPAIWAATRQAFRVMEPILAPTRAHQPIKVAPHLTTVQPFLTSTRLS